jgi:hypothetical protein
MKTNKNIIIASIIGLVLTLNLVMAFSPISIYSQQTPLNLYPGEETEVVIHIYPTPEEGVISVEATLVEGMEIASITDASNIYESSSAGEGLVHVKVSVPLTATIGSEYTIKSRFVDKTSAPSTGTVGFVVEATNAFKVVVVEKPQEPPKTNETETPKEGSISLIWWILGIIVIVVVIYFIIKRRKE